MHIIQADKSAIVQNTGRQICRFCRFITLAYDRGFREKK